MQIWLYTLAWTLPHSKRSSKCKRPNVFYTVHGFWFTGIVDGITKLTEMMKKLSVAVSTEANYQILFPCLLQFLRYELTKFLSFPHKPSWTTLTEIKKMSATVSAVSRHPSYIYILLQFLRCEFTVIAQAFLPFHLKFRIDEPNLTEYNMPSCTV
jgi:hypothetical protein